MTNIQLAEHSPLFCQTNREYNFAAYGLVNAAIKHVIHYAWTEEISN
jgi:hypothetical protein